MKINCEIAKNPFPLVSVIYQKKRQCKIGCWNLFFTNFLSQKILQPISFGFAVVKLLTWNYFWLSASFLNQLWKIRRLIFSVTCEMLWLLSSEKVIFCQKRKPEDWDPAVWDIVTCRDHSMYTFKYCNVHESHLNRADENVKMISPLQMSERCVCERVGIQTWTELVFKIPSPYVPQIELVQILRSWLSEIGLI